MADYYELLGVPTDATREDIRNAYRTRSNQTAGDDKAALNQAWNVLSDPYQRGRYDQQLSDGTAATHDDVELNPDLAAGPGAELTPRAAKAKARMEARDRAMQPNPLPAGMEYPQPAQRFAAFGIDFAILLLVFLAGYFFTANGPFKTEHVTASQQNTIYTLTKSAPAAAGQPLLKIDAAKKVLDAASTKDSNNQKKQNNLQSAANKKLAAAKKANDTASEKIYQAQVDAAKKSATGYSNHAKKLSDAETDVLKLNGTQFLMIAVLIPILMLLIVMIPSVKRGQTIGKRLRGIRVVSINGADASFGQLLIRYGLPIVVAVSTAPFLPSIGALLALFGVLLWPRNKNRQGIHDRVAKTRVIQDRPALADPTDPLG